MALLLASIAVAAVPVPAARGVETYDVVVAGSSGSRTISSVVALEVAVDGDRRVVRATRTEGSWEEGGRRTDFDSDAPTGSVPWVLRIQHHVASVPAVLTLDASGAPAALEAQEAWLQAVRSRVYDDDFPVQALTVAEALVDPVGLVRGYRRDFPGRPSAGEWVREERLAGLAATRTEICEVRRGLRRTTWTCEGRAEGPSDGPALLHEVTTRTVMEADRRGLVQLESAWQGTLLMLGPDGRTVLDRPIAERRLVRRRSTPAEAE